MLGEQGLYPQFFHFTGEHCLCMGASIGVSADGKRVVVGGDELWGLRDPMVEKMIVRDVQDDR